MAARAIASGTISFGLVSIPIRLYTATSPQSVSFNQLHAECGTRIKQQIYCPTCDKTLERNEIVKGYEYAKGQFVRFEEDELKKLEAEKSNAVDILEFVPLESVDHIYVDRSYYLGPDKGGDKAYQLLSRAMQDTGKIAVGQLVTRGKEQLVLIRPYKDGLILHYVYYADEVRAFEDVPTGKDAQFREGEMELAERLIDQLATTRFEPAKYKDEYRDRVMHAVEQKVAGQEVTVAPEAPPAQIIDLFEALKASLSPGGKPIKGLRKTETEEEGVREKAVASGGAKRGPRKAEPRAAAKKRKTS